MTRSDELFSKGHFLQMQCFSHRRRDPGGHWEQGLASGPGPCSPLGPSLSCRPASVPAGRLAARSGSSQAGLLGTGRAEVRLSLSRKQRGEATDRALTLTMVLDRVDEPQGAQGDLWSLGPWAGWERAGLVKLVMGPAVPNRMPRILHV